MNLPIQFTQTNMHIIKFYILTNLVITIIMPDLNSKFKGPWIPIIIS